MSTKYYIVWRKHAEPHIKGHGEACFDDRTAIIEECRRLPHCAGARLTLIVVRR